MFLCHPPARDEKRVRETQEGAITGTTRSKDQLKKNTFLIWEGGEVEDFVLELEYRILSGNSGIQYRSRVQDPARWIVSGYQADLEAGDKYSGILYEEGGRGILALRGKKVEIDVSGRAQQKTMAKSEDLQKAIQQTGWNAYRIEASGQRLRQSINGQLMCEVVDRQEGKASSSGILALQVHVGPPMKVQFRNLVLQRLQKKP